MAKQSSSGPVLSPRQRSKVLVISQASITRRKRSNAGRTLLLVWLSVGVLPLLLQIKSYWKFASPHKLTATLVVPKDATAESAKIEELCPVEGLFIAGSWWNVAITHYYSVKPGRMCHFVIPQYDIHGSYVLGSQRVAPSSTTPSSCANESFPFEYYFYHGSISYYAFYEEGIGTYCVRDKIAYVRVQGLGTFDMNGAPLAKDRGAEGYRFSVWYSLLGLSWITFRVILLRRSFVLCKRYGKRCEQNGEALSQKQAAVYMQESVRLAPHNTTNAFRFVVLYMLLEGMMSDLFLLIAQDGLFAKTQYISLGYNLSGVLSMVFEMLESMKWLPEKPRIVIKRLLFSYETCLIGELLSAAVMNHYLTWINRSDLRDSRPAALAVSYYVWSLVGHGVLVLGLTAFIASVRVLLAFFYVLRLHRSCKVMTASCSVDTILGVRNKMIMLGGYAWHNHQLFYKREALKAFGIMKLVEEDGAEYLVAHRIRGIKVRRDDYVVMARVCGNSLESCEERQCKGYVCHFEKQLGGVITKLNDNKVLPWTPVHSTQSFGPIISQNT